MTDIENAGVQIQEETDDMPELESAQAGGAEEAGRAGRNKFEKKIRQYLGRLGMKPFGGVLKVTIRQGRQVFAIDEPIVYKGLGESYIVVGEAKQEQGAGMNPADWQSILQQQQFAQSGAAGGDDMPSLEETPAAGGDEDASGVDAESIELVLQSAPQGTTRAQAIAALKEKQNPVDAVLHLTMKQ